MLVITLPDIISWDTYPQKFTKWLIANFFCATSQHNIQRGKRGSTNVSGSVACAVYAEFEVATSV